MSSSAMMSEKSTIIAQQLAIDAISELGAKVSAVNVKLQEENKELISAISIKDRHIALLQSELASYGRKIIT